MVEVRNRYLNKRTINIIIMLTIMFGFGNLPAPGAITELGMKILGVFIGVLYGWIFIEVGSTSIVSLAALVLIGCAEISDVLIGVFGTQIAVTFLMVFLFTAFIEEKNLGEVVAYWLIRRKFLAGRPYLLFFFFLLATYFVGVLSGSLVAVFLMIALFRSLNEIIGFEMYSKQILAFVLGISFTAVLGELGLPTKGVALIYMSLYTGQTGQVFDMVRYMLAVVPMSIFITFCYTIFCKFILRINMKALAKAQQYLPEAKVVTKDQKIAMWATAIYMTALVIPSLQSTNPIFQAIAQFGSGGIAFALFGVMMLIHIDREPIVDVKKIAKRFPWEFYFMCVTVVYIAGLLTQDATGIKMFLTESLYPLVSDLGSFGLVVCLCIVTAILTNFINNVVAGSLVISLGIALSGILPNLNLPMLTIMVALAGMLAIATPAASPNSAWIFAQKDLVKASDMMLYGFATVIFLVLCASLVGYWYVTFIF